MQKKIQQISLLLLSMFVFLSCGKHPQLTLPSRDGKWNLSGIYRYSDSSIYSPLHVNAGIYDGTAVFTKDKVEFSSDTIYQWKWECINNNKLKLSGFMTDSQGLSYLIVTDLDLISASYKKEVWHRDKTIISDSYYTHYVDSMVFTR